LHVVNTHQDLDCPPGGSQIFRKYFPENSEIEIEFGEQRRKSNSHFDRVHSDSMENSVSRPDRARSSTSRRQSVSKSQKRHSHPELSADTNLKGKGTNNSRS
jgi:hypothetical protein